MDFGRTREPGGVAEDAAGLTNARSVGRRLTGRGPLGGGVHGVERLAPRHEQAIPLGSAEADVADDLGDPDAPDELPLGCPDGHAAVPHGPPGVARAPQVAVDVTPDAVRAALHPVDHEV